MHGLYSYGHRIDEIVILSRPITKIEECSELETLFPNTHILHIFGCSEKKNHERKAAKVRLHSI